MILGPASSRMGLLTKGETRYILAQFRFIHGWVIRGTSISGWKVGELSKFVRERLSTWVDMDVFGFPTGPISANTWNFFYLKKKQIPCSLPFLLYTLILSIVVHALNTCSSYTTRLGSFFEGFCLNFVMFLAKVMIKKCKIKNLFYFICISMYRLIWILTRYWC